MSEGFGRRELEHALGFDPSDAQWAAISAPLEPAVIVAGAGTGKTTSMSARVAYLVGSGAVHPDRVLGLTFTNKAAGQLLAAIRSRVTAVGELDAEPTVSTYNAFAGRLVSEFGLRIGREPDATLLTDGLRYQHAYALVCGADSVGADSLGEELAHLGGSPLHLTKDMLTLDSELSELSVQPELVMEHDRHLIAELRARDANRGIGRDIQEAARKRNVLARLVIEWRSYKARRDLWEYADQVRLAQEIVQRYPETVLDIRRRYDIVLLDEYQDTSIAQRTFLQNLFGDGFPVTAVGDPCQAIYGWRGASVDNIESFPAHFTRTDGTPAPRYSLAENRRSGPAVLHVANEIATELRAEHTGTMPLEPADGSERARVDVALFDTIDDEVEWLANAIRQAHLAAERDRLAALESATEHTDTAVAVLCTTGADIRRIDGALRRLGVPTQVTGAAALLADPAVADLRALLELVHEPTANPACVQLLSGARWRVGVRDLAVLGDRARELSGGRSRLMDPTLEQALEDAVAGSDPVEVVSLSDALADPGDRSRYSQQALAAFAEVSTIVSSLRSEARQSVVDLSSRAMSLLGVDVEARVADPTGHSQAALVDFLTLAAEIVGGDARIGLGGFLTRLREAERFDVTISHTRSTIPGAVQLMTVFAAKGLEFETVFVPFVSDGAFPGGRARGRWTTGASAVPWPLRPDADPVLAKFPDQSEDSISKQHERYLQALRDLTDRDHERLAYVALTRAERALTVTGHWWGPGQAKPRGPHRFLAQIKDAVESADPDLCRVITWAEAPADQQNNPVVGGVRPSWPVPVSESYRAQVKQAADAVRKQMSESPIDSNTAGLPVTQQIAMPIENADSTSWQHRIQGWHEAYGSLATQSNGDQAEQIVRLSDHVGATTFLRALKDPGAVAEDLLRPMPRKPSRAAARGVAWHAWVETAFGQQSLWGLDDLPGAADAELGGVGGIGSDAQLEELKAAFQRSRYASKEPVAVEQPFSVVIGGRVINGRIDAVFADSDRFEVVDWKTGGTASIDPRQLAIYRLAWSQIRGVDWRDVDATFVMVATGEEVRPDTDDDVRALLDLDQG